MRNINNIQIPKIFEYSHISIIYQFLHLSINSKDRFFLKAITDITRKWKKNFRIKITFKESLQDFKSFFIF